MVANRWVTKNPKNFYSAPSTLLFSLCLQPNGVAFRWGLLLGGCRVEIPKGLFVHGGCLPIGVVYSWGGFLCLNFVRNIIFFSLPSNRVFPPESPIGYRFFSQRIDFFLFFYPWNHPNAACPCVLKCRMDRDFPPHFTRVSRIIDYANFFGLFPAFRLSQRNFRIFSVGQCGLNNFQSKGNQSCFYLCKRFILNCDLVLCWISRYAWRGKASEKPVSRVQCPFHFRFHFPIRLSYLTVCQFLFPHHPLILPEFFLKFTSTILLAQSPEFYFFLGFLCSPPIDSKIQCSVFSIQYSKKIK